MEGPHRAPPGLDSSDMQNSCPVLETASELTALGHEHLWPLAVAVDEDVEVETPGAVYGTLVVCVTHLPWSCGWCPGGDGCWRVEKHGSHTPQT